MQGNLIRLTAALGCATLLGACATQPGALSGDAQRALVGAGAGAVVAKALDEDIAAGAAVGAAAGALCDDAGVCQPGY